MDKNEITKEVCTEELVDKILMLLESAPSGQIIPKLRDDIIRYNTEPHTLRQKYFYLSKLSKRPETEVSRFVSVLCDVEKFYIEPECNHKLADGTSAWVYEGHDSHKDYYVCAICGESDSY